jgi:hypothetical protein
MGDGTTKKTSIVNGKTVDGDGTVIDRSKIVTTTGDDGRTWAGAYKGSSKKTSKTNKSSYSVPSYTPKKYSTLSHEDALSQALDQYQPMADLAKKNTRESYAAERDNLPQLLNARGQSLGGARIIGEQNLFNDQTDKINDIDLQTNSAAATLAQSLQAASEARADSLEQQDYNRFADTRNAMFSKYQSDLSQENYNKNMDYQVGRDKVTDANTDRTFGLQDEQMGISRDQLGIQQGEYELEKNSLSNDPSYRALQLEALKADIGATNRSNTSSSSSSSGSGTFAQQLSLAKYNDGLTAKKEAAVNGYVKEIVALMTPKTNSTFGVDQPNTYYRNGHAYPKEALKAYKSLIGDDEIYNEVYNRIMGQYDPATSGKKTFSQLNEESLKAW